MNAKKNSSHINIDSVEGGIHHSNIAGRDINFIHKITNFFTSGRDEQRDLRNRRIMLERVRSFWVEGVLEKSLHKEILIQLGKQEEPEATHHFEKCIFRIKSVAGISSSIGCCWSISRRCTRRGYNTDDLDLTILHR